MHRQFHISRITFTNSKYCYMEILTSERFFSLMTENLTVTNSEIKCVYEEFIAQVVILNESENDNRQIYRILNNTRIELVFIESLYRYEQEKKCS
jgi:hypothetical protein